MIITDPRNLPQSAEPLIVLSNQTNSWIGNMIDFRTDLNGVHPYDHAMLSINAGKFVTQGLTYVEEDMSNYLIKGGQLAFVQLVNRNPAFVNAFRASVLARLAGPWWIKMYDFIGIFGQAIGIDAIHTPGLSYCSVDVIRHLKAAGSALKGKDSLFIQSIPLETNPEKLWSIILSLPEVFSVLGTWDSITGVTV